jgi:hypothetical protein
MFKNNGIGGCCCKKGGGGPPPRCRGSICAVVRKNGVVQAGIVVTFIRGTTTVGTATTNGLGVACVSIDAAGFYTISAAITGCGTTTVMVVATCSSNVVQVNVGGSSMHITGCFSLPLPGALVQVYDHATGLLLFSATTDSTGNICPAVPGVTSYDIKVTKVRFADFVRTNTTSFSAVAMTPAAGYQCCFATCPDPVPLVLHLASPSGNDVTITSDPGGCFWQGSETVNVYPRLTSPRCFPATYDTAPATFLWLFNPGISGIECQWPCCSDEGPAHPPTPACFAFAGGGLDSSGIASGGPITGPSPFNCAQGDDPASETLVSCDPFLFTTTLVPQVNACHVKYFAGTVTISE